MTVEDLKKWLVDHGHAQTVRDLQKRRAKKAEYVATVNALKKKRKACPKPSASVVPGLEPRWTWTEVAKSGAKAVTGLAAIVAFALLAFYYGLVPTSAIEQVVGSQYAASLKAAMSHLRKLLGLPSTPIPIPPPARACGRRAGTPCDRRVPPTIYEAAGQACVGATKFGKLVSTLVITFHSYLRKPATKTLISQVLRTGKAAASTGAQWTVRVLIWILQSRAAEVTRAQTKQKLALALATLQGFLFRASTTTTTTNPPWVLALEGSSMTN